MWINTSSDTSWKILEYFWWLMNVLAEFLHKISSFFYIFELVMENETEYNIWLCELDFKKTFCPISKKERNSSEKFFKNFIMNLNLYISKSYMRLEWIFTINYLLLTDNFQNFSKAVYFHIIYIRLCVYF